MRGTRWHEKVRPLHAGMSKADWILSRQFERRILEMLVVALPGKAARLFRYVAAERMRLRAGSFR
jgi:hypothetical protein